MNNAPCSAYDEAGGMVYFPRMLDKIRRQERGELHPDFHQNLGKGADGKCAGFLRVPYEKLTARVREGGSDEEILEWCYQNGRRLNETDLFVWNNFAAKIGWNDFASDTLKKLKHEHGLADRDDIQTMGQFFEVDEGRKT